MGAFTITTSIRRPRGEVFEFMSDGSKTPLWYEAVQSARKTTSGPIGRGSRYEFTRNLPQGRVTNEVEVSEFEVPRRVTFTSISGPTPFRYRYDLAETHEGTALTLHGEIRGKGLSGPAALLAPLASQFFKRGMEKNLAALTRTLEG